MDYNIKKISKDIKSIDVFIKQCVYWSRSAKDLLVGRYKEDTENGKITRYNQIGHLTQSIQHNTGVEIYSKPIYITENNNGDVVVSDSGLSGAVVVT